MCLFYCSLGNGKLEDRMVHVKLSAGVNYSAIIL